MREIKFRGKRVDNGKWVCGHYTQGSDKFHYITNPDGAVWVVTPESVGQSTGLKDGDCESLVGFDGWNPKDMKVVGKVIENPELLS